MAPTWRWLFSSLGAREVAVGVLGGPYSKETLAPDDRVVIDGQEGALEPVGIPNLQVAIAEGWFVAASTGLTEAEAPVQDCNSR